MAKQLFIVFIKFCHLTKFTKHVESNVLINNINVYSKEMFDLNERFQLRYVYNLRHFSINSSSRIFFRINQFQLSTIRICS